MNPNDNLNQSGQPLTKRQRRLLRRQLKTEGQARRTKLRSLSRVVLWGGLIVVAVGAGGFGIWDVARRPPVPESDVVSRNGLHWHPQMNVAIKGSPVTIPKNLGTTGAHSSIHTHEDPQVIHLEFSGRVLRDDLRLKRFFELWGKQLSSTCVLDQCNGPDGKLSMTVNGQANSEFDRYVMRDKDQIEIRFD
ncbi:MAG: hypothetical protein HY420_02880 [Candidatus Kerfeldbacteria bacterium]|nr:hypothetical protein [Candidatus Kerfeldbacteria bacterium]